MALSTPAHLPYYLYRTMRCLCGESLKCIRRHPANAERDEYQCVACGRTVLRYDLQEGLRRVYRRRPTEDDERRIPLVNHPSAPTVHTVGHVKRSAQNTEERPLGLLACIVV